MRKAAVIFLAIVFCSVGTVFSSFLPEYETFTLKNGLTVVLVEDHCQPMINFNLTILTGSSTDPEGKGGLAGLTVDMLRNGTAEYSGGRLVEILDSIGSMCNNYSHRNAIYITGDCLSRDLEICLNLLGSMVKNPIFDNEALERLKNRYSSWIRQARAIPKVIMRDILYDRLYGNTGYGGTEIGSPATFRKITIEDLAAFHKRNIRPNNAVLTIAGDFERKTAEKLIKANFSDWTAGSDFSRPIVNLSLPDTLRTILIDRPDIPSTEILIGRPALPVSDKDFPTLVLLDYLLGGSVGSRLRKNLMLSKSLVTNIGSAIEWSRETGIFQIQCTTPTETVGEAVETIFKTISEMKDIRPSVKELEDAKRFFRGHIPAVLETRSEIVSQYSCMYMYGVPLEFYSKMLKEFDQIDPPRLHHLAKTMLDEKNFVVIIAGPERELRRDISHIAPIEVYHSGPE